jgi:hypothetical protein
MGKKTDVSITAGGLGGVTVIGMTISNTVGSIPTALIDVAPGGPGATNASSAGLGQVGAPDQIKRNPITLSASVKIRGESTLTRSIKFLGLIDGVNLSNVVGSNSYQVVLKNRAQKLTELTTITPGLVPASVNIWRHAGHNMTRNTEEDPAEIKAWANIEASGVLDKPPIEAYTEIIKWILNKQVEGWAEYLGTEQSIRGSAAYSAVLGNGKYQKAAKIGLELMNSVDLRAVSDGTASKLKANSSSIIINSIGDIFKSGPSVILENYMNFLAYMGCTIVFSNSKMFVVPANSVLKQNPGSPGRKALSSKPNQAYPSDYNSYVYNDNGYRDVGCVLVLTPGWKDGTNAGALSTDRGLVGEYCTTLEGGTGVLAVKSHPWMGLTPTGDVPAKTSVGTLKKLDGGGSMVEAATSFKGGKSIGKNTTAQGIASKKLSAGNLTKATLDNYAETKMYQAKYIDRQGTVTMDFNPNWVPGTGGSLFIRETGMTLAFHVTNVTHRIDVSAPNTGAAITTVSFNCGRLGASPPGTDSDVFLGYNLGKEQGVQSAFIGDNS